MTFAIGTVTGEPGRPVPMNHLGARPLMGWTVAGQGSSWSNWPESRYGEFALSVAGTEVRLPVAKVHGQRVLVNYEPADENDFSWLAEFEEGPPSYLWRLRPVVWIGAEKVAVGEPVQLGSVISAQVSWEVGGHSETVGREWVAGDAQGLLFMARPVTTAVLEEWKLKAVRTPLQTPEDMIGLQLHYMQLDYLHKTGQSSSVLAAAWKHRVVEGPRLTLSGFAVDYQRVLGVPIADRDVRLAFDAARLASGAVPQAGVTDASVLFAVTFGAEASFHEGTVVSDTYGFEATTTVSGLSSETSQGETLVWACRLNGDQELPRMEASQSTLEHVSRGFDSNLLVVAPHSAGEIETYIMLDPITGASGFYLSGGRNGSLSQWLRLKDRFELVEEGIDLLLRSTNNPLHPMLPPESEMRDAALRALFFGMIDGFASGVEGELVSAWETIKNIPRAITSIPKSANFLWHFTVDKEFRREVAAQVERTLQELQRAIEDFSENWEDYLGETAAHLVPFLSDVSGVAVDDPMIAFWVMYYPTGWLIGLAAEFALVAFVSAGVGKLLLSLPQAQRLIRTLRLFTAKIPGGQKVARAFVGIQNKFGDAVDLLRLGRRIKNPKVQRYLDDTIMEMLDDLPKRRARLKKADDLTLAQIDDLMKEHEGRLVSMLNDVAKAMETPPVEDEVYLAVKRIWEAEGLTPEEAELLRIMRPDAFHRRGKNPDEYDRLQSIIVRMRYVITMDFPLEAGEIMRKQLSRNQVMEMITGVNRRGQNIQKNRILGFLTRNKYLKDAKTPDELVALTRQDGFDGFVESGNKEAFWVEFPLREKEVGDLYPPFAEELAGPMSLERAVWPFSGSGFTATKNGRWVPEWRFMDDTGHVLEKGAVIRRMDEHGVDSVFAEWDGRDWIMK